MPGKLPQGKIFCFLCNGILVLKNNDKARALDHLKVEHMVSCNLDFLIGASSLEVDDIDAITAILNDKISNNKDEVSDINAEEPIIEDDNNAAHMNEEPIEDNDTIVVGGMIEIEHLAIDEVESTDAELLVSKYLLPENTDYEQTPETSGDEKIKEEYVPNVVELDVLSLSYKNQCPICDGTFAHKKSIGRHLRKVHKIYKHPSDNLEDTVVETFDTTNNKALHSSLVDSDDKNDTSKEEIKDTTKENNENLNDKNYQCKECGEWQTWKDHYKHVRTVHNFSAKEAFKSLSNTKKRLAEQKIEAPSKKVCWSKRLDFEEVQNDEHLAVFSVNDNEVMQMADIDENIPNIKSINVEKTVAETKEEPLIKEEMSKEMVVKIENKCEDQEKNTINNKVVCNQCDKKVLTTYLNRHLRQMHSIYQRKYILEAPDVKLNDSIEQADNQEPKENREFKENMEPKELKDDKTFMEPIKLIDNKGLGDKKEISKSEEIEHIKIKSDSTSTLDQTSIISSSASLFECRLCDFSCIKPEFLTIHKLYKHKETGYQISNKRKRNKAINSADASIVAKKTEMISQTKENNKENDQSEKNIVDTNVDKGESNFLDIKQDHAIKPAQEDSSTFAEKLKLKLMLDSDDEEEDTSDNEKTLEENDFSENINEESSKNAVEKEFKAKNESQTENNSFESEVINLKVPNQTSKVSTVKMVEQDILKDPNLPAMWLVKYQTRPDGRVDKWFISPDNQKVRSHVKLIEFMTESKKYSITEIKKVQEYVKKTKLTRQQLRSLDINNV